MQADRPEVPVPAAEPCLHHEVEADLIERLASRAVVEPAQRDGGLIVLAPERSVEEAIGTGGTSSNGNITGYTFGYRWYPIMFSRAGVALDWEYSRIRTIGQNPLSGDGSGVVASPTAATWSSSIYFGIDFDF